MVSIHKAVESGRKATVIQALEAGDDVNERAALDNTPLHLAAKKGKHIIAELLLKHGAEVDAKDYKSDTPLHHAAHEASLKVVELLLEHGANAAAVDTYQDTPLHKCAGGAGLTNAAARTAIAEKLIAAGCAVDAVNYSGQTALWHAAWRGNLTLVRSLISHGADPMIRAKGAQGTAIDAARMNKQEDVLKVLEDGIK